MSWQPSPRGVSPLRPEQDDKLPNRRAAFPGTDAHTSAPGATIRAPTIDPTVDLASPLAPTRKSLRAPNGTATKNPVAPNCADTPSPPRELPPPPLDEPLLDDFESALRSFAAGDKIAATWSDRPGCDDFDPVPITWTGVVLTGWRDDTRDLLVRWDRKQPRLVGGRTAHYPPWVLPTTEAIFATPTKIDTNSITPALPVDVILPPVSSPPELTAFPVDVVSPPDPPPPEPTTHREPHGPDEDDEPEDLEELAGWWTGENFPEDILSLFRRGNGATLPPVAALQGSDLRRLVTAPLAHCPKLAAKGLVHSTRLEHQRMLRRLATLPVTLDRAPLTTAIITFLDAERSTRHWRCSTVLKMLCTAQGALNLLPAYVQSPALQLATCPIWRQAMRAAQIAARQELPHQPKPATWTQVCQTLDSEPSLPVFAAILLSWITCARTGCVLQLAAEDVRIADDHTLSIRFRRGKGVRARGPYTVHTLEIPPQYLQRLQRWLTQRRQSLFNKACTGEQLKNSLRRTDPQLEQRSLRRGSIQTLARSPGITDETLMLFSGHTQVRTLRRYLGWGEAAVHTRKVMQAAARGTLTKLPSISSD